MENEIVKYLSKYITVTKEIEEAIIESEFIKCFAKGTLLLKEGDVSKECYFIIKGCIRSFYIVNGEEKTTDIYTEGQAVTPSCYGNKKPSENYLECVEDVVAGIGTPELEKDMYQRFPQIESLNRVLTDRIMANYQDSFDKFKMAGPEQRYLHLIKSRPDLLQRVPQHQIASYLGVKPESLSRIRKRISKKEQ